MNLVRHIFLLLVLSCGTHPALGQNTWHVDDNCSPPGAGTDVNPFCTIQDGVDASSDGDTVLVAPGTYTGDGNRDIRLFGKLITLKSTEGPNKTVMDIEGSSASVHGGFFLIDGESQDTVIEGFTITNGYLVGDTGGSGVGGGGGGAAIFVRASSPTIRDCILEHNTAASIGAPFPEDGRGGAVYVDENSQVILEHCIIANNAAERGGGLHVRSSSQVTIRSCLVIGNVSDENNFGGGMNAGRYATIVNTTVAHNISGGPAGGVSVGRGSAITNCSVWGNQAAYFGDQVTVSDSQAPLDPVLIEYSNIEGGPAVIAGDPDGFIWGPGMIDADPLFVDSKNGDYRISAGSPCVDAGDNLAVPAGVETDLSGGPRFLDDPSTPDTGNPDPDAPELPIVDMGSYEFDPDDCNNNDVPDEEDIKSGASFDVDENGIPDECQSDCNNNDIPDSYEINEGMSEDCDGNGVPDECEPDCNENGQVDACDIADGGSNDCDGDGVLDECETDPGPVIILQPVSQEVAAGEEVVIVALAQGVLIEYQWRKDGVDLSDSERMSGTNSPGLTILAAPEHAGSYDCVVTDFFGECITSDAAVLTVTDPCPADFDDDGETGASDLAFLLGAWGPCPDPEDCPADLNDDGQVGSPDLPLLLGAWGPCP